MAKQEQKAETAYVGNDKYVGELLSSQNFTVHSSWSSPEALARYIKQADETQAWHKAGWEQGSTGFYGTQTMREALNLSETGWKEGAEKADRIRGLIAAMMPTSPKMIKYGIAGAFPNVPRAVAGNLFNMHQPDAAKSKKKPVLTLVSNMAVNCGVDPEAISNQAAVVAALVDQIEDAGYACEVLATATTQSWNSPCRVATTILVKASTQPVDLPRLSYSLGHASFYRRLVFGSWGLAKEAKPLGGGLGGSCKLKDEPLNEKGIYTIPASNNQLFRSEEDAMTKGLKYIKLSLVKQGCPAFVKSKPSEEDIAKIDEKIKAMWRTGDYDDNDEF